MPPAAVTVVRGAVLALAMATAAAMVGGGALHIVGAAALGIGGLAVLHRRRRRVIRRLRSDALAAGLPDVIDLLAATVDGGIATDVALMRVAGFVDEPLRSVLLAVVEQAGASGIGARLSAVDPALRPLGSLLLQSEELGVPIADSLRLLAADARARARAAARERAAAAAPKMLLVVGALLAPASLLIVIGGQLLVLRDVAGGVLA